jgi:hypothetical protein
MQLRMMRRVTIKSEQFTSSVVLVRPPYPKVGDEVTGHLCGVPVNGIVTAVKKETGFIITPPGRANKRRAKSAKPMEAKP